MTITIQVNDLAELEPIQHWLKSHTIKFEQDNAVQLVPQPRSQTLSHSQEQYSRQLVGSGTEAVCFGDAAEWQRQQRQDRELPFNR